MSRLLTIYELVNVLTMYELVNVWLDEIIAYISISMFEASFKIISCLIRESKIFFANM
jgi:hypothetical protein